MIFFWVVSPCGLVGGSERFGETEAQKVETARFIETLASTSQCTRLFNRKEHNQNCHPHENLKYRKQPCCCMVHRTWSRLGNSGTEQTKCCSALTVHAGDKGVAPVGHPRPLYGCHTHQIMFMRILRPPAGLLAACVQIWFWTPEGKRAHVGFGRWWMVICRVIVRRSGVTVGAGFSCVRVGGLL
jgi:hypothetical protein